jgi:sirohydrochlorin ferrochelatase
MRYPPLTLPAGRSTSTRSAAGRQPGPLPPLVAVAHGSTDPRAAASTQQLLGLVADLAGRAGLPGLDVRTAYLGHSPPSVSQVLSALAGPQAEPPAARAVVLPLLLTAAYHSDVDLPGLLGQARTGLPGLRLHYGHPLGPDPLLLRALDRRLAETGALDGPAAETSVVLAAAGSARPAASAVIARLARQWQAARGWRAVVPAYAAAAAPGPAEAVASLRRAGAHRVVVATYLLAPGFFADRIAVAARQAGASATAAALGAAPEVAELVLRRYAEALATPGRSADGQDGGGWLAAGRR